MYFNRSEHGITVDPEEVSKLSDTADRDGEVTKDEFLNYAKHSEFFKNQLGLFTFIFIRHLIRYFHKRYY